MALPFPAVDGTGVLGGWWQAMGVPGTEPQELCLRDRCALHAEKDRSKRLDV